MSSRLSARLTHSRRWLQPGFIVKIISVACAVCWSSCALFEATVAELRTDIPEMAVYVASFNASQSRYKLHVRYEADLARKLAASTYKPALAVSRYLKIPEAGKVFQSLDHLFSELLVNQSAFYPGLLEQGNLDGRQLLLPVSFNLPLIAFSLTTEPEIRDTFVLTLDDLETLGTAFNQQARGAYTRMGFAPRWSAEFLHVALRLFGVDFRQGTPLRWNRQALQAGLDRLREFSKNTNGSVANEEDFKFKYLYLPAYRSLNEGRIRFASLDSATYFLIPEERRSGLTFRWISRNQSIPVAEDLVYAGICRGAAGKQVAEAFLKWFYTETTQRRLLEDARDNRAMETSFGLAGGFSAIRTVNEKLFPLFYPALLGRLPPATYLGTPSALPTIWQELKQQVVLPFLLDATGPTAMADPNQVLDERIRIWMSRRVSY
jgi:hypothetical protein